jgi:hypothetical protein
MQRPKPGKGQLPGLESGPVPLLPIRCAGLYMVGCGSRQLSSDLATLPSGCCRDTARQQLIDLIDTVRLPGGPPCLPSAPKSYTHDSIQRPTGAVPHSAAVTGTAQAAGRQSPTLPCPLAQPCPTQAPSTVLRHLTASNTPITLSPAASAAAAFAPAIPSCLPWRLFLLCCCARLSWPCPHPPQKRGKKALVLDPAISGPLTQLDAGLSELFTEHGVAK